MAAALAGDAMTAARLARDLLAVVDAGFAEPSPAVWKAGLHTLGLIGDPGVRAPLLPATPGAVAALVAAAGQVAAAA